MRRLLFIALLVLGIAPALAQSPIEVTADSFVVDQVKSEATFTGNVVITRADLKVWADKVLVSFGAEGLQNIQHVSASGRVRLKTADQDATGDRATFDPNSQVMRLSGNVTVVNASGTLNGPELVVDLANQTTTFSSNGGGRVTGVFTPQ
jgi:lipopolysaccharide export system protein LptA